MDDPRFTFHDAQQFAFLYENAHLLLVSWKRDDAKLLFLIREQTDLDMVLAYPGAKFTDTVLDAVQPIFFVQVQNEELGQATRYVLGSYFVVGQKKFGAYYEQENPEADVVLFQIHGQAPEWILEVPDQADYLEAAEAFMEQHGDFMKVQAGRK